MTDNTHRPTPRQLSHGRLEAFSDGVFAIAITLLVLDIAIPASSGDDLLGAIRSQWPSYLAYVVSFLTIGAAWVAHNTITEHLRRADATLLRLNLILLLVVSFLPFPTRLLAEYIAEEGAERVAVTIYGVNVLLTAALTSALWRYAVSAGLVRDDIATEEVSLLTSRLTPGLAGYLVLLGVGLVVPILAVVGYFAVAVYFMVPVRSLRRQRAA